MTPHLGTQIDWEKVRDEVIAHLQALIRIDTVNPPGNELVAARYLQAALRRAKIETMRFEPAPGRGALVARLKGNGSARPLLLLAHMDVVGVEGKQWIHNPFGGDVVDGYLYGRGAIDDKGMLACNLQAMLLLKRFVERTGGELSRDVIFVATGDEETGGLHGIGWLAEHHPEVLDAEWALNEGGRIRIVNGRPLYAAIQCAEKVPHAVIVRATGTSGHAAVPLPDNPITRLARAVVAIAEHHEPLHLTDVSRGFFGELAAVWPDPEEAKAMSDIASDDSQRVGAGDRLLSRIPGYDAVLRNGISPTMLSAGIRTNVIPAEATATLNVRTLPGVPIEDLLNRLRGRITEPGVELRVRASGEDAPASPVRSEMFDAIKGSVRSIEPDIAVVPYLSTGATDSAALRRLGMKAYGLLPFPLTQEDEGRMHGHDERVPVSSLGFGVRVVYGVVQRMSAVPTD